MTRRPNKATSYLTESNIARCLCSKWFSDVNLRRILSRIPFTEVGDVNISNFTVKDGCCCLSTSTTNRFTQRTLTIVYNVYRRSIGITRTTCQQVDIGNTTVCNSNIKNLSTNRLYNSCSWCCLVTTTSISDSYRHNLPVRRHRASCFGVNTVFGGRINVDSRRITITKTKLSYSDRSINQTTLRIDCRVTTLSTTRVDKGNCRNKVVTRTRVGDLDTRDLSCCIINSNFSSSTRTIDQIARFSDTNNRRVV